MGDELGDLSAVVSEQGLALRGLEQAAADAEERQKSSHAKLLELMAALLKNNREGGAQQKSGGEQKLSAVDTAGRDASPSLDSSDDGTGSQEEKERGDVILRKLLLPEASSAVEGKIEAMPPR